MILQFATKYENWKFCNKNSGKFKVLPDLLIELVSWQASTETSLDRPSEATLAFRRLSSLYGWKLKKKLNNLKN